MPSTKPRSAQPLLKVKDLSVEYLGNRRVRAVDGVSFELNEGESLGLVGESGCGKTTTARAILRLLPSNGQIVNGEVLLGDVNLVNANEKQLSEMRWRDIAFVPQSSMNSLDPVQRVGKQIEEAVRAHRKVGQTEATQLITDVTELVGVDPRRLDEYPHQFSGGMRQRLVFAMALVLSPRLIIADEPTTALDVITQDRILERIVGIQNALNLSMVYISHDVGVISRTCTKVAVMYAGRIVEWGSTEEVLDAPSHPYTMALRNAVPAVRSARSIISLPGVPPSLDQPIRGCRFAERCPFAQDKCREVEPHPITISPGNWSACHYARDADSMRSRVKQGDIWSDAATK